MSVVKANGIKLRAEVIKHFFYREALSLAELRELTGKSLPVLTTIMAGLVADGYLIEEGLAPSSGGRRPALFKLNPKNNRYIVAVAMDQRITRINILDLMRRKMISTQVMGFNLDSNDLGVQNLLKFIKTTIKNSGIKNEQLLGVGIGMPGFINKEDGINYSFFQSGGSINLSEYLSEELDLPVFLDNDSSLIALAELHFGAARGYSDVLVVNLGWGTGLGMIINGSLYRGSTGYAGEFSHVPLSSSNKLCSCGKRGCLEVETSLTVMVEKAENEIENGAETIMSSLFSDESVPKGYHFLTAVSQQDPLAISILSETGYHLGKGIATLIHILNPKCIVLAGRGAKAGKMWLPSVQQAINEFCIARIADQTKIVISDLAEDAELLAAASLVVENSKFEEITINIDKQLITT